MDWPSSPPPFSTNQAGMVTGGSGDIPIAGNVTLNHAFLWQEGKIRDLNTLIPAGSRLTLKVTYAVNDAGEIMGYGTDRSGNQHLFVLHPMGVDEAFEARVWPDKPSTWMKGPALFERHSEEVR